MNRKLYLAVAVVVLSISLAGMAKADLGTSHMGVASGVAVPAYYPPVPFGYGPYYTPFYDPFNYGSVPQLRGRPAPQIIGFNDRGDMALIWEPGRRLFRWVPIVPTRPGLTRPPTIIYGPGRPAARPASPAATPARSVVGEVIAVSPGDNPEILMRVAGNTSVYRLAPDTTVLRGRVGGPAYEVPVGSLMEGDRSTLKLNDDGVAVSVRAQYRLVTGKVRSITADSIALDNREAMKLSPRVQVLLPGNYTGSAADITVGSLVAARVSPVTGRIYTVRIADDASASPANVATDTQLSLNSSGPFGAGDEIVVTYRAKSGGKATLTIPGVASAIPMAESPAGVYTGRYTVKEGDSTVRQRVKVTFKDPNGATIGRLSGVPITVKTASSYSPRITSPRQGEAIASPIVVTGTAEPGDLVRVTVGFRREVKSVLPVEGVTAVEDVRADSNGVWSTSPLAAASPLTDTEPDIAFDADIFTDLWDLPRERPIVYTITASTIGSDGRPASDYSIDVSRSTGRVTEGSLRPPVEP